MTRRKDSGRRRGFTLIEVLLVLTILVIIASFAVMALAPRQTEANIKAAKTQIEAFKGPLGMYRLNIGYYPQSLEELRMRPADAEAAQRWAGPYLDRDIPLDPWHHPYRYKYPGQHDLEMPDIWSAGPDGVDGNEDDVTSWGPSL
jgi:general secretion pathway protein G